LFLGTARTVLAAIDLAAISAPEAVIFSSIIGEGSAGDRTFFSRKWHRKTLFSCQEKGIDF